MKWDKVDVFGIKIESENCNKQSISLLTDHDEYSESSIDLHEDNDNNFETYDYSKNEHLSAFHEKYQDETLKNILGSDTIAFTITNAVCNSIFIL